MTETVIRTSTERWRQRSSGIRRAAASLCALALLVTGCGGDEEATAPDRGGAEEVVDGELHDCAADLPVPEGMVVAETALGRDQGGGRTCVVSLETAADVAHATTSYLAALDADGWDYEVQQREDEAAIVHLVGPTCGVVLVLPEEDATTAMVSLLDCDRLRVQPPAPPNGEG